MDNKNKLIQKLAAELLESEKLRKPMGKLSEQYPSLSLAEAYAIQFKTIEAKLVEGHTVIGKKIGLTSKAMQNLLGVDQPDFGHLLEYMKVENKTINTDRLLQPRIEGELAFILKKDLRGPNVSPEEVFKATEYIVPAIEIVDSRIANWNVGIVDTVADNGSSAMYALGSDTYKPDEIDLPAVHMTLFKNGEKINEGWGKDVLGTPAYSIAWLANALSKYSLHLKAGEIILSGSLSAMTAAAAGDEFKVVFDKLGAVELSFI